MTQLSINTYFPGIQSWTPSADLHLPPFIDYYGFQTTTVIRSGVYTDTAYETTLINAAAANGVLVQFGNAVTRPDVVLPAGGGSGGAGLTGAVATTLPYNLPATATISGSILYLGIPQGSPGSGDGTGTTTGGGTTGTTYTAPGAPTSVVAVEDPVTGDVTVTFVAPTSTGGEPILDYIVTPISLTDAPGAPINVVAVENNATGDVTVTFTPPASSGTSGIVDYIVTPVLVGGGSAPDAPTNVVAVEDPTTGNVTVTFTGPANTGGSGIVDYIVTPVPVGTPGAPSNVVATEDPATGNVTVTFTAPTNTGGSSIADYIVTPTRIS